MAKINVTITMKRVLGAMYGSKTPIIKRDGKYTYIYGNITGAKTVPNLINLDYIKRYEGKSGLRLTPEGVTYITKEDIKGEFTKIRKAVHIEATLLEGVLQIEKTVVLLKGTTGTFLNFQNLLTNKGSRIKEDDYGSVHKSDFVELTPKVKKTGFYASLYCPIGKIDEGIDAMRLHIMESLESRVELINSQVETLNELAESVLEAEIVDNNATVTPIENDDTESPEDQDNTDEDSDDVLNLDSDEDTDAAIDDILKDEDQYSLDDIKDEFAEWF